MTFSSRIFPSKTSTMRRETLVERENQLTLLHQQILMRREALFHTSGLNSLGHSMRSTASGTATVSPGEATLRNARLLKDMENLNQDLKEQLNNAPSPRFVTLQNNYWSMVRSLLPLWEQSLPGATVSQQQGGQHQQPQRQQHSGRQQQGGQSATSTVQQRQKGAGKSVSYARATK